MADDVVITGMGIVSPIGTGERAFWDALTTGKSGAAPVNTFATDELTRSIACQVKEQPPVQSGMGRASNLAVEACRQAVDAAGLSFADVDPGRTTVIAGTTMGETQFIEDRLDVGEDLWLNDGQMREVIGGAPGCIASNINKALGIGGSGFDLYGACAAGNMAMATARRRLQAGECDVALCGGADGFSRLAFIGFMRLRVMAAEVCRPFDQERDGLFVGEGATFFVLERASDARARGAKIRARVLGAAMTCESYHPTRPDPEGDGLSRATITALQDAGLKPDEIDYVCAHGTGTPQNDAIEVKVLEKCFPKGVAFSSIKALTGHPMGAAAATEAAACVMSLESGLLIPTWHLTNVLEPCSMDPVVGGPRETRVRCVLNNSAGFGGYNSSVILAAA